MQTIHLLFNPASGSYSPDKAEHLLKELRSAGLNPQPILPQSASEASQSVADICRQFSNPSIIAAGGDGTLNTLINSTPQGSATIGIIPLGTANVMARELEISSIQDAVARIARGNTRLFSVGEATSAEGVRLFALMAGIGLDAAAVAGVRPTEKRLLGKWAYILSGLRQLISWDSRTITVTFGQRQILCNSLVIANAAHYAGPFQLAPQASLFSSDLILIPMQFSHRLAFLRLSCSVLLHRRLQSDDTLKAEKETIRIEGNKYLQLDGDSFGETPVSIRLIPEFNRLIV